jgi:hypothetical protein
VKVFSLDTTSHYEEGTKVRISLSYYSFTLKSKKTKELTTSSLRASDWSSDSSSEGSSSLTTQTSASAATNNTRRDGALLLSDASRLLLHYDGGSLHLSEASRLVLHSALSGSAGLCRGLR